MFFFLRLLKILELPSDGLTREQRQKGWIAIHIALACYCFWLIATICDDYFVPAIEGICSGFNLNEDVGKINKKYTEYGVTY